MENITELIESQLGIPATLQTQIFSTIFILLIMSVVYSFLNKMLYKTMKRSKTYYIVKKTLGYIFVASTFILVARVWFKGIQSLTTYIGLFSAGVAIAMKDIIMNIGGWIYIVWKAPFTIGDRIETENISGDVIDIELFSFAIMEIKSWLTAEQSTGRIVYIPNSVVFKEPIFNYSKGIPFIWNEIPIHITFDSNWKKAKRILEEIADTHGESISEEAELSIKEASKKFMVFNAKLYPRVYTSIDNQKSITLTIRYMCSYRKRRDSSEKIYEDILDRFKNQDDIRFSYPTQIVYDNQAGNRDLYKD